MSAGKGQKFQVGGNAYWRETIRGGTTMLHPCKIEAVKKRVKISVWSRYCFREIWVNRKSVLDVRLRPLLPLWVDQ